MKRFFALFLLALCISLFSISCLCAEIPVKYTYDYSTKSGYFSTSSSNPLNPVFDPVNSVFGSPIGYCYFGDSRSIDSSFTFTSSEPFSYVIVPMYEFYFTENTQEYCSYWSSGLPTNSVDIKSGSYTSGSITFKYYFHLYESKQYTNSSISLNSRCTLKDLGYFDLPIYAPKFIYNTDPSTEWDSLNTRLEKIESALDSIGRNIENSNATTERILEEVRSEREMLENPRPQDVSKSDHVANELSRVEQNVSDVLGDLSIPEFDFDDKPVSIPDTNEFGGFLNFFVGLYPLNIILPAGVGLWVVYLIIHGLRT